MRKAEPKTGRSSIHGVHLSPTPYPKPKDPAAFLATTAGGSPTAYPKGVANGKFANSAEATEGLVAASLLQGEAEPSPSDGLRRGGFIVTTMMRYVEDENGEGTNA